MMIIRSPLINLGYLGLTRLAFMFAKVVWMLKPKNRWIVCPATLIAATPVGANTTGSGSV